MKKTCISIIAVGLFALFVIPTAGAADIAALLKPDGLLFFSTLVQPADFDKQRLNWWYVGPRNGHISIFTKQALAAAWGRCGYKTVSYNDNIHMAFRSLPKSWPLS